MRRKAVSDGTAAIFEAVTYLTDFLAAYFVYRYDIETPYVAYLAAPYPASPYRHDASVFDTVFEYLRSKLKDIIGKSNGGGFIISYITCTWYLLPQYFCIRWINNIYTGYLCLGSPPYIYGISFPRFVIYLAILYPDIIGKMII